MNKRIGIALMDAVRRMVAGNPRLTNGKINPTNVHTEAGVGRATFYRHYDNDEEFKTAYDNAVKRANQRPKSQRNPQNIEEAYEELKKEVKLLRERVRATEISAEERRAVFTDQLYVLKKGIQYLEQQNTRLENSNKRAITEKNAAKDELMKLKAEQNNARGREPPSNVTPLRS